MRFEIDTQTDSLEDIQKVISILQKHIEDHKRSVFFNPEDEEYSEKRETVSNEIKNNTIQETPDELDSQIALHQKDKVQNQEPVKQSNKQVEISQTSNKKTVIENPTIPHTINTAHNRDPRKSEGSAPSFKKLLGLIKNKQQANSNS